MCNKTKISKKAGDINLHFGELKEHLDNILEDSRDLLYKFNFQTGRYDYLSKSVQTHTGYRREDVMARGAELFLENLHPDDKEEAIRLYEALANSTFEGSEFIHEYRYRHKDGRYLWRSDSVNILRDEKGNIVSIFGNTRDITPQKKMEQRQAEQEKQYKKLYQNARVALYRTRISDGKLLECNLALAQLYGYNNIEECLSTHHSVNHYIQPEKRGELLKKLQTSQRVDHFEIQIKRLDGSLKWVEVTAAISPESGHIEGALHDITASKILTNTERKVLTIVLQGKSNKEIAKILHRSVRTIEDHRAHIMHKLKATNLIELTQKAIHLGIEPVSNQ